MNIVEKLSCGGGGRLFNKERKSMNDKKLKACEGCNYRGSERCHYCEINHKKEFAKVYNFRVRCGTGTNAEL